MPVSEQRASAEVARHEYRLLKWTTVLALALACAWPLALNLVDPDLWGHVRYAQDWLAEGELPRTASHTFTAVDYPWINHENLAELVFALGYRWLGTYGLLVAKCAWGMIIILAMVWISHRQRVHAFVVWPLMMLVTANLQAFFLVRPQVLSFGLCALTLVVLDRAFADWPVERRIRVSLLCVLPAVFAVWVNTHGGFVAGLCIVGAFLGGRIMDCFATLRGQAWRQVWPLVLVGVGCLAATLANPYGWQLHRWLVTSLSQPRPEITEWAAPKPADPIFWSWIALLGVATVSLLASRLRRDWVQVVILLLVAWQSAMHLRHIAFLALLIGFWIPPHLQSALGRLRPDPATKLPVTTLAPWLRSLAWGALLVAVAMQSFGLGSRLSDFPVERNRYPVDAIHFMANRGLRGRLVVSFNWAQYAIAALAPDVQVAFDGRFRTCYPQEVVDMHFDFLLGEFGGRRSRSETSGPIVGSTVLRYGDPELVLVDRRYPHAVDVMKAEATRDQPEWVLLYCDRVAELWGRSDRYDDPTQVDYLPLAGRVLDAGPRDGQLQWPALPARGRGAQLAQQLPPPRAADVEL